MLNPAAARGPDRKLYLFPRLVAKGNYSRIGIARVNFDESGDPCGVERLGIALEPEADYELRPDGSGGCEDPRITFVEKFQQYVMTYTALSPAGPRIALAGIGGFVSLETNGARDLRNVRRHRFRQCGQQGRQPFPGRHSQSRRKNATRHPAPSAVSRHEPRGNRLPGRMEKCGYRSREHLDFLLPDGTGRVWSPINLACSTPITGWRLRWHLGSGSRSAAAPRRFARLTDGSSFTTAFAERRSSKEMANGCATPPGS